MRPDTASLEGPRGPVSQKTCGVMPAWPIFYCRTVKIATLGERPLLARKADASESLSHSQEKGLRGSAGHADHQSMLSFASRTASLDFSISSLIRRRTHPVSRQFIDSARSRPKTNMASIGIDRPPATRHTSRED